MVHEKRRMLEDPILDVDELYLLTDEFTGRQNPEHHHLHRRENLKSLSILALLYCRGLL
jgi:hypothetical protein